MTTEQIQKLIEDAKALSASIDQAFDKTHFNDLPEDQQKLVEDLYFYTDMIQVDVEYFTAESRI